MENDLEPVQVAPGIYWVGKRDPKSIFHANPFLRVFDGAQPGGSRVQFNLLIDPGSASDVAVVTGKVGSVVGGLQRLSALFLNHQDPDVGSSATMLTSRFAPKSSVLCSEDTWRLVVHTGLPRERYFNTDKALKGLRLPTGHKVLPVPSPFCHFRGATMLYDPETRVLFTGDLFGGLTPEGETGLWAEDADWKGVRAFHQLYMPTNVALRRAVAAIRALDPAPTMIAPQHGRLLRGDVMEEFLRRMEQLPVGLDILDEQDATTLDAWTKVLNSVLDTARGLLGSAAEQRLVDSPHLTDTLEFTSRGPRITHLGRWTVESAVGLLTSHESPHISNVIKMEALSQAELLGLPVPRIALEEASGDHLLGATGTS